MSMQDIRVDPMLLDIYRDILLDMIPIMHHIIEAIRILAARRVVNDTHSSSNTCSSSTPLTHDSGHDPSPCLTPPPSPHLDEKETPIPPQCELPNPPDYPSSYTTYHVSTTIVDMIITLAGLDML